MCRSSHNKALPCSPSSSSSTTCFLSLLPFRLSISFFFIVWWTKDSRLNCLQQWRWWAKQRNYMAGQWCKNMFPTGKVGLHDTITFSVCLKLHTTGPSLTVSITKFWLAWTNWAWQWNKMILAGKNMIIQGWFAALNIKGQGWEDGKDWKSAFIWEW